MKLNSKLEEKSSQQKPVFSPSRKLRVQREKGVIQRIQEIQEKIFQDDINLTQLKLFPQVQEEIVEDNKISQSNVQNSVINGPNPADSVVSNAQGNLLNPSNMSNPAPGNLVNPSETMKQSQPPFLEDTIKQSQNPNADDKKEDEMKQSQPGFLDDNIKESKNEVENNTIKQSQPGFLDDKIGESVNPAQADELGDKIDEEKRSPPAFLDESVKQSQVQPEGIGESIKHISPDFLDDKNDNIGSTLPKSGLLADNFI